MAAFGESDTELASSIVIHGIDVLIEFAGIFAMLCLRARAKLRPSGVKK